MGGCRCRRMIISWEPLTLPDRHDTYSVRNVDNSDVMDLADTDNEVVAVDDEDVMATEDEEVFFVSSSWSDAGVDSSVIR